MNFRLLLVFVACSMAFAETGAELFQKAVVQERAAGNLEEAIKIYQRVAREYSKDRPLAAKALVQAARCYEKLGQDKAVGLYERVAREFGDQREQASIAREALAKSGTGKGPDVAAMSSHLIPMPLSACLIMQSDGKQAFYLDCRTRDLMASTPDGATNRVILKRESGERIGGFASAKLSPDEKRMVFTLTDASRKQSLAIINTDGTGLRRVSPLDPESRLDVQDWSPDGRNFLAVVLEDQNRWLASVSVADGSIRKLVSIGPAKELYLARYSRDGQYIAWTQRAAADDIGNVQIASAAEGANAHVLVDQPAALVDWTRDGRYVLFISDRNGSPAIFAQAVFEGQARGKPVFVGNTSARPGTAWIGRDGALMYRTRAGRVDVFRLSFGTADPEPVSKQSVNRRIAPAWSPDGRRLAFIGVRGVSDPQELILTIREEASGQERNVPIQEHGLMPLLMTWTSDNSVALSWSSDGRQNFAEVNVATGAFRRIPGALDLKALGIRIPAAEAPQGFWAAPNGNLWLEFLEGQRGLPAVRAGLIGVDRSTGRSEELISKLKAFRVVMSPDASQVAALERQDEHSASIAVKPASGGDWRQIATLPVQGNGATGSELTALGSLGTLTWSPDGKFLYYVHGMDNDLALWRIAASGGQPERLASLAGMGTVNYVQVHPNGRDAVVENSAFRSEVWSLRNYLPKDKPATASKAR
jgi:Tol biopolymer transport system component